MNELEQQLTIQERLSNINEEGSNFLTDMAKDETWRETYLHSLIRNIFRYSVIRPKLLDLYLSLIEKLVRFPDFQIILESNIYFGLYVESTKLIDILCEKGILGSKIRRRYQKRIDLNREKAKKNKFKKLIDIIQEDDLESLQVMASQPGFDVNKTVDNEFSTCCLGYDIKVSLINLSAYFGSVKCFKFLLANCARLNAKSIKCAINGGEAEVIHIIEQQGIKVSEEDIECAVERHHTEIFDWIHEKYPHSLTKYVYYSCVKHDFVNGIIKGESFGEHWYIFDNSSNISLIKSVFEQGVKMGVLNEAIKMNLIDFIPFMKGNIDETVLQACEEGHIEIVSSLLQAGCNDIKIDFSSQLEVACRKSHTKIVRYLLALPNACFEGVREGKYVPLIEAAGKNLKIVKMLLDRPEIDINQECGYIGKGTALISAVDSGKADIVSLLLTCKGINVNARPLTSATCGVSLLFLPIHVKFNRLL